MIPDTIKIYHITHIRNLESILTKGIISDSEILNQSIDHTMIGMGKLKEKRLKLSVKCHSGLYVGNCVPFYFCIRSQMLYIAHKRNHPEVLFKDGQNKIVYLEADLYRVVDWANNSKIRWAFSSENASAAYTTFYKDLNLLKMIDWHAVRSHTFSESKQAEFLIDKHLPWNLIDKVSVYSRIEYNVVNSLLLRYSTLKTISIEPSWYF